MDKKEIATGFGVAVAAGSALAADSYDFDKDHTNILLKVNHLGFSNMYLEVHDYSGGFVFDQNNPSNSKVDVQIYVDSIDSGHDGLNEHLRGTEFFESAAYPNIRFRSTSIVWSDASNGEIEGELTIKGTTLPVSLNVVFNKAGRNDFTDDYHAGFSASAVIKRSDYGIDYAIPAVGDKVEVILEIEGIRKEC